MRHFNKKTFTRPRNDVFEPSDTALCLGASHNMSPLNNRCVVITCFSNPQDHSVTRGYMDNCCPTLNAASGESGNNRPFIGRTHEGRRERQTIGIDQQGGKGGANYTKEVAPTLCSDSHGTPHGVAIINQSINQSINQERKKERKKVARAVLDRCGNNWKNGKGGCGILVQEEHCPCLATMFHPFVITT